MKEINLARISEKVSDIETSLRVLREYAARQDEDFLQNEEAIRAARYSFIVLIEAATNIANHLSARLLSKAPNSFAESFIILGQQGLIEGELGKRLAKMTGFRNLLVHGYDKVDDRKMLRMMREELGDVDLFLSEVARLLRDTREGIKND